MTAPAVTVVIPAYRAADDLPAAVAMLTAQTFGDFEVIIVDDGSGDDTGHVAEALARRHDKVRAVLLPENGGVARARERAVEQARGEYLWFVDADDAWPETALATLVAAIGDADVVVADAVFRYQNGTTRPLRAPRSMPQGGRDAFAMLLRGEITGHLWNKLFRRAVMSSASFTPARVQSDLIMVADALAAAHSVRFAGDGVYEYRLRAGSIITSTSQRAHSLRQIDEAVGVDARRLGLEGSDDHRYFRARYIQLSGIKDALFASYPAPERRRHLAERRGALTWADVALFVRRRDPRRLALATTAKVSVRAHRALLRVADR